MGFPPVRRFPSRALGPSRQTLGTELVSLRRSGPRCPLSFSARPSLFSLLTDLVRMCPVGRRFAFNMFFFAERAFGKGQVCCGLFGAASLRAPTAAGCARRLPLRLRGEEEEEREEEGAGGTPRSAGVERGSGFGPGEAAREREATGVLRLKGVTIATKWGGLH